ncbi:MAG: DUF4340 domain-containing protein [Treponema sp.]|jgi:hypothetical protein|nr:DUF4340 domain-containing protein [Treponema sp.]
MVYKRKLAVLSGVTGLLALVYVLTLIFEPERAGRRSAAYSWIDSRQLAQAERIVISGPPEAETAVELVRRNNIWYTAHEGNEYPARQLRVDDFLGLLGKKAPYPVQASTSAAHERLGLDEKAASRIRVSGAPSPARDGAEGAAGPILLDLLVGQGDQTGREVYLRKAGQNEVRSGEDRFSGYISGSLSSWYNLRLFPESEDGKLDVDGVQRLTVYPPAAGPEPEPQVFTRNGSNWTLSGGIAVADLDNVKVDSYIRGILNIEGDDFSAEAGPGDPIFNDGRVALELGDGSIRTLRLGAADESNRRLAAVSGSSYVYSLAGWAVERLFRDAAFFEKPPSGPDQE